MRDIKFRGKRKDGNGWIFGYVFRNFENKYFIKELCGEFDIEVEKDSIGQYTGFDDTTKNNLTVGHIYEGDIVFDGVYLYVIFYDLYNGFRKQRINDKTWTSGLRNSEYLEIVGNIYENPELLNKK